MIERGSYEALPEAEDRRDVQERFQKAIAASQDRQLQLISESFSCIALAPRSAGEKALEKVTLTALSTTAGSRNGATPSNPRK
jgi:hypothetical protein